MLFVSSVRSSLTHKCASLMTFMIFAMNASMWKIFFDPWRMRSSWASDVILAEQLT